MSDDKKKVGGVWYWRCVRCGMFIQEGALIGQHKPESVGLRGHSHYRDGQPVLLDGQKCG